MTTTIGSATAYGIGILGTLSLGSIPFFLLKLKTPVTNPLYGTTSALLLTYSIGASLLMYAMMVYLFTAFPTYAPMFILSFNAFLLLLSMWTLFFNPWKVKARKQGASGVNPEDPAFLSIATTSVVIPVSLIFILRSLKNPENMGLFLILFNTLVIPFFFLTSGMINSFALNNFTHNF
jgi:hypothetical protein